MVSSILKCSACSHYTLQEICPACGAAALAVIPPKFSLQDKYGSYRRQIKKEELIQKGLY